MAILNKITDLLIRHKERMTISMQLAISAIVGKSVYTVPDI